VVTSGNIYMIKKLFLGVACRVGDKAAEERNFIYDVPFRFAHNKRPGRSAQGDLSGAAPPLPLRR
jgi:hypothetical protein